MRLEAASVLLQWAVGGMAFCWFTTRRRQVGLGYGWLLRTIYGLFARGAFFVAQVTEPDPVRDAAALAMAVACFAVLAVSIVCKDAGVRGQRSEHDRRSARVAAMTGIERTGSVGLATRSEPAGAREFPPALDLVPVVIGAVGLEIGRAHV